MTEFDDVIASLERYRPVLPGVDSTVRIARGLTAAPSMWRRPWIRVAAAVALLAVPATWWALSQRTEPKSDRVAGVTEAMITTWKNQPRVVIPGVDVKADVVVVGFNDWQCPPCLELYAALQALFAEYDRTHPGTIARVLLDWPWNMACNPYMSTVGHQNACEAAAAVGLAREHGRGDELVEWLRVNRESLEGLDGAGRIIEETRKLLPGLDVNAGLEAQRPRIAHDVEIGHRVGVGQTPLFFVNGVRVPAIKAEQLDLAIKLALASR